MQGKVVERPRRIMKAKCLVIQQTVTESSHTLVWQMMTKLGWNSQQKVQLPLMAYVWLLAPQGAFNVFETLCPEAVKTFVRQKTTNTNGVGFSHITRHCWLYAPHGSSQLGAGRPPCDSNEPPDTKDSNGFCLEYCHADSTTISASGFGMHLSRIGCDACYSVLLS